MSALAASQGFGHAQGIFYSLKEAQILIEGWRQHYHAIRPHSALRWTPPAPEVRLPKPHVWPATTLAHYAPTNYH